MNIGKLKLLVNDPVLWEAFKEYAEHRLFIVHRNMETDTSTDNLLRYQGEAKVYKRLLSLRDEVNGLEKGN